jgi:hypothetical protein
MDRTLCRQPRGKLIRFGNTLIDELRELCDWSIEEAPRNIEGLSYGLWSLQTAQSHTPGMHLLVCDKHGSSERLDCLYVPRLERLPKRLRLGFGS